MLASSEAHGTQQSAAWKRRAQLLEWNESATNQESATRREDVMRVKFDKGTIFLAACSQCDLREVQQMLDRGVDPNTTNVDGLTALHQACIDDNISMVEFLVKNGAQINVMDNEGWSPLHATASCGYIDIASFLIKNGANIGTCNSDGDLPIDIAEGSDMENLLAEAMNNQSINADEARGAEELAMLNDANDWLNDPDQPEEKDPNSGATALHVAAAKGYTRVVMALLKAGADPSGQDHEGWTPLHGAAHWGQEEVCRLLAEAGVNMAICSHQGQRAIDLAEDGLEDVLQELEEQQSLNVSNAALIVSNRPQVKRRSSVTRMSNENKDRVAHNASIEERGTALISGISEDPEIDEMPTVIELPAPEVKPRQETASPEPEKPAPVKVEATTTTSAEDKDKFDQGSLVAPRAPRLQQREDRASSLPDRLLESLARPSTALTTYFPSGDDFPVSSLQQKLLLYRRASGSDYSVGTANSTSSVPDPISWRAGLRKTGSSSAVPESSISERNNAVQKSASLNVINISNQEPKSNIQTSSSLTNSSSHEVPLRTERRPFVSIKDQDRSSYPITAGRSGYIPYYKRQQMEQEAKLKEQKEAANVATSSTTPITPTTTPSTPSTPNSNSSTSTPNTPTSTTTSSRLRFEAPKRDEAAETNRKIKAKRARETRRSTQGVTQDDVKAAEATLKIASNKNAAPITEIGNSVPTPLEVSSTNDVTSSEKPEDASRRRNWKRSFSYDPPSPLSPSSRTPSSPLYSPRAQEEGTRSSFRRARDTIISGSSSTSSVPEALSTTPPYTRPTSQRSSSGWRNGTTEDQAEEDTKDEDKLKSRTLRSRRNRRERRSTGVIYYDEADNDKDEDTSESTEISPPSASTTSTPSANTNSTNTTAGSTNANTSSWSSRPFTNRRYGSASDVPAQMAGNTERGDRSSYTRYSRRQPTTGTALDSNLPDTDVKKIVEDVKTENDRLKSQVKELQSELTEVKSSNKSRSNGESLADKRDYLAELGDMSAEKRALERRCSELEEEIKKMEVLKLDNARLKEENGALIRVISKLSK